MPASSGIFWLLDLIRRDPNAGGLRGFHQPGMQPGGAAAATKHPGSTGGMHHGFPSTSWSNVPEAQDPNNWFLSPGDLENPLNYMAWHGRATFGPQIPGGDWKGSNDTSGYFTLRQLYQDRNMPQLFQGPDSDLIST